MKKLIVAILINFCIFAFSVNDFALSQEKIKWRGQSFVPGGMPISYEAAEYFAKKVSQLSNGRLVIDMNPAGTIVPVGEMINAVHKGVLDVSCGWSAMWRGLFPSAPLFGTIEAGPEVMEYIAWVLAGGGLELWQEMYDQKNWQVKVLPPYFTHGPETFAWSNKPIRKLEDFKGLRFRTGGYYWGKVLTKMGASVVTLPGSEIIPALERKVLDAAEWSVPALDITMGFQNICKYMVVPGVHQPSTMGELLIHKKSWEKLSPDLQNILISAAKDAWLYARAREMNLNPQALEEIKKKGVQIIYLTPEVQRKAKELSEEVFAETAAQDPFFAKVLNSIKSFRKKWEAYQEYFTIKYK